MKKTLLAISILVLMALLPQALAASQCPGNSDPNAPVEACWTSYRHWTEDEPPDTTFVCNFVTPHCELGNAPTCSECNVGGCTAYLGYCGSTPCTYSGRGAELSRSTYAACRYSASLNRYWCADGNGKPGRWETLYTCHYFTNNQVTSWTVCSSDRAHVHYPLTVDWLKKDGKDCSNSWDPWCNTPPTAPLVTVDYGTRLGIPKVTESINHAIPPPIQSSLICRAEGSTDADGESYTTIMAGNLMVLEYMRALLIPCSPLILFLICIVDPMTRPGGAV